MRSAKLGRKYPELSGIKNAQAKIYENIKLLSPDGILYTRIECIAEFARIHKLHAGHLSSLLLGKGKSLKGWIRIDIV